MNCCNNGEQPNEAEMVKLYRDLSGASETAARGVYMHIFREGCNGPLPGDIARLEPRFIPAVARQFAPREYSGPYRRLDRAAGPPAFEPAL
jgi:hypothetical protein